LKGALQGEIDFRYLPKFSKPMTFQIKPRTVCSMF